jgi:hypothetical protein
MAFTASQLCRVGPQNDNAPTLYTYKTADTLATVDGAGYFNSASNRLKVGDVIFTYTTTGPAFGISVVNANSRDLTATPPVSGVVDIANHTSIGTIDSD